MRVTKSGNYKIEAEDGSVYSDGEEPFQYFNREEYPQVKKNYKQPVRAGGSRESSGILEKLAGQSSKLQGLVREQQKTLEQAGVDVPSTSQMGEVAAPQSKVVGARPPQPVPELPKDTLDCPVCHKVFQSKAKLREHYVVHTKQSQFKCNTCDIPFTTRTGYDNHMKLHNEYKCHSSHPGCAIWFPTLQALTSHMEQDVGYKNYPQRLKCDLCGKCFRNRQDMLKHRKHRCYHNPFIEIEYFYCKFCNSRYREKKYLTQHEKNCKKAPKRSRGKKSKS